MLNFAEQTGSGAVIMVWSFLLFPGRVRWCMMPVPLGYERKKCPRAAGNGGKKGDVEKVHRCSVKWSAIFGAAAGGGSRGPPAGLEPPAGQERALGRWRAKEQHLGFQRGPPP